MLTKSQSAAPRSARQEARSFTYDKGRTLIHDLIASPLAIQTKNYNCQWFRNSFGVLFNAYSGSFPNGQFYDSGSAVSLSKNGFQCKQSRNKYFPNGDGVLINSNSNVRKSVLQNTLRVSTSRIVQKNASPNRTFPAQTTRINNSRIGEGVVSISNQLDSASEILLNGINTSTVSTAIPNVFPMSTLFRLKPPVFSARNSQATAFGTYLPLPSNPYGLTQVSAYNDPSADPNTRPVSFRISIRSHGVMLRGTIARSSISWQQTKNDEAFLRILKYRNP